MAHGKSLSRYFLQDKLNLLTIDDPFQVKSSNQVIAFLQQNPGKGFSACSIDIKDLYYSLPQKKLLASVEECIDSFGVVAFQNSVGISNSNFLELLTFYFNSTFSTWNESVYLQSNGIGIGSCIAPILSDIYLAHHDRLLDSQVDESVARVFRFVDDFLVLMTCAVTDAGASVSKVLSIFHTCLDPLVLTHETPSEGKLRFLDLAMFLKNSHVCWRYEPRCQKPLTPFASAHSKLVKRGIAKLCFKKCPRKIMPSCDARQLSKSGGTLTSSRIPFRPSDCNIREPAKRNH